MKVALVCRTFLPRIGGMEAVVAGLATALTGLGHTVRVVTLRDPGIEALPPLGYEVLRLVRAGPARYPFAVGLAAAVRDVDVVHVHGIDGLLDQLVWRQGPVPVVVSTHGGYFHTARNQRLKALWLRTATRASLSRAAGVWFTSVADQQVFVPAQVAGTVLENGVDLTQLLTLQRRPVPGRFVVLGRLAHHKGIDRLLAVLSRCKDRPFSLQLVGPEAEAGLADRLLAQAAQLGLSDRVSWMGPQQAAAALAEAHTVVVPSRYEGFGLVAVEAMAAGVPVVLADIPAFRRHADVAPLVDFDDPAAAATGLFSPCEGDRIGRAKAHAATFDWGHRVATFEAAYHQVLQRPGSRPTADHIEPGRVDALDEAGNESRNVLTEGDAVR